MLLRICLILAILSGGAVVAVNFVLVQKAIVQTIGERDDQKKHRLAAETERDSTKKTLAATQTKLDTTTKSLTQATSDLKAANSKADGLQKEKTDLADHLTKAEAQRDEFQANLVKWNQLHLTPEAVVQIQDDLKKATNELAGSIVESQLLNTKKNALQKQLDELVSTNTGTPILPAGLKGKVLAVDPKYAFVILDIGEDVGVLTDGIMMVARDGKFIGKVQIASVTNTQSVANILPAWSRGQVMEGDEVLY